MTRFNRTVLLAGSLCVLVALSALAQGPSVTKSVLGSDDGSSVVLVRVTARDQAVYGVTITDATGSVEDIVAPEGWAGITSGDLVLFRTVDTPIPSGRSLSFRIVTTNAQADMGISFRGKKSAFGSSKKI
ncbi:MAG: hypothetical protein OEN01_12800 [Candidatus Krumholzibacteria bacterium]|nr:hypothetical protein [Candidatus Krumholzibacteria bacterium]